MSTALTAPSLIRSESTGLRAIWSARAATCSARRAQSIVLGFAPAASGTAAIPTSAETTPTNWVRLEDRKGMSPGLIGPNPAVLSHAADLLNQQPAVSGRTCPPVIS